YIQKLGFHDFKELAQAILNGKISIKDLRELKPVFRLHPPSGGFKYTIKKRFGAGGELGYRGSAINDLVRKMA
ncbi:MAG: 50S ribosomal protein L30, partial [Thermoprotei archaeon]